MQGPLKLLLLIASAYTEAFSELLDVYRQLGETLGLLLQSQELFPKDNHMANVLAGIYKDILEFHRRALKYFQQPSMSSLSLPA